MMQLAISARDKRTLAFGTTVIAMLFGGARGGPALVGWEKERVTEAAELTAQASASQARVRLLSALRDSLAARRARLAPIDSLLFRGSTAAAAAAGLAAAVDQLASLSRIRVNTMQLRGDSAAAGSIATVAIRMAGVGDVVGLSAFLRYVESDATPLAVRELSVSQPDPGAPESKIEALRIDVLIEGLARIDAPNADRKPK